MSITIILDSNDPEEAGAGGGTLLKVYGEFANYLGTPLRVHVGELGSRYDPECYSGKPGQGNDIYPSSATMLKCYLPELPVGGPYSVFVRTPDNSAQGILTSITILPAQHYTKVFELRSVFPRFYRMGPRNMDALEPLP